MLKIFTLLLFTLCVITSPLSAQTNNPPEWEWANSITGYATVSHEIAVDNAGNTFVTGMFQQSANFGDISLTGLGGVVNGYVAKYDNAGKEVWATKIGGIGRDIALDASGNIYVTGNFKGVGVFGAFTISGSGTNNFFLVKLNPAGNVLWVKSTPASHGVGLGVDRAGYIYVTGSFADTRIFFENTDFSSQSTDIFLVKYDPDGKEIWVRKIGGQDYDIASDITVDEEGNSYLTGRFQGVAQFETVSISSPFGPQEDAIFIAKYNAAGKLEWVKQTGGVRTQSYKIDLDPRGNILLTGYFFSNASFGSYSFDSQEQEVFVAKYTPDGEVIWARRAGGSGPDVAQGLATDYKGNTYISGFFSYKVDFGPFVIQNSLGGSFFIAKYDTEGKVVWVKTFDGNNTHGMGYGLAVDALGGVYLHGVYGGDTSFGETRLLHKSEGFSAFVAKLESEDNPAILTSNLPELEYCAGAIVPVSFLKSGSYAVGNTFTAQLSDASGSFANPVTIGTGQSAPIMAELPAGIAPGAGYKIRVVAGVPAVIGRESSIPVSIIARPMAPVAIPTASCGSGNVTFAVSGARAGEAYHWYATATGGEALATGSAFRTPPINSTTHYYVSLVTNTGCESERTLVTATIDPALNVQAGSDVELCIGSGEVQLTGFSPAGGTWSGAGVSAAGVFNPSSAGAGTHTLTYTFDNGHCAGYSTTVVRVTPIPTIQAGFEPVECGTAESPSGLAPLQVKFTNSTSGATAYLWEFGDGATSQEATPGHTYNTIGNFDVYLTTYYGNDCSSRQQVTTVQVERRNENANVFTPNGDGLNDYFVLNVSCLPLDLKVFDRWGKLVFEQADYKQNWDGGNQRSGIYFYHATTSNGQNWKGWVELIR
ncbi:SBBP repeat-containing protein [Pontibacter sp. FD36]|uniref:SBBP repeat-containing protein n=1 Tax=Pontibacter sp. FD36 TaxID=2789860 RepID=UPI0018AA87DC|nr:SBBP repeat-containing protein [Pontibacter sp. FD36]MBF8965655.1 SBBP repeat-containing protein [Pontibacter sp. FD36]